MIKRSLLPAAVTVAVALVAPASSSALTYCVNKPSCVTAGGTSSADLDTALSTAEGTGGPDRIEIGPGTYTTTSPSGFHYFTGISGNSVDVVGSGRDATFLRGPASTDVNPWKTLRISTLADTVNHVSDLSVRIPNKAAPAAAHSGIFVTDGTVERVSVTDDGGGTGGIESGDDLAVRDCDVTLAGLSGSAAISANGGDVLAERCHTAGGFYGLYTGPGHFSVGRDNDLSARYAPVYSFGGVSRVEDNLLRTTGSTVLFGQGPAGLVAAAFDGPPAVDGVVIARHITAIGTGAAQSDGVRAEGSGSKVARMSLDSSVLSNYARSVNGHGGAGLYAITVRYSNLDLSTALLDPGGTNDFATGNVAGDPKFADAGEGNFQLSAGSPAIDTGDPAPVGAFQPNDLAGKPRTVDGDGNGSAITDMGAYEFQPPAPATTPTTPTTPPTPPATPPKKLLALSGLKVTSSRASRRKPRRYALSFSLTLPASVQIVVDRKVAGHRKGRRCLAGKRRGVKSCKTYKRAWSTRRNASAGPNKVTLSSRLKPGKYRLSATPRGADGAVGAKRSLNFRIRR
jgi:hypothetical protein